MCIAAHLYRSGLNFGAGAGANSVVVVLLLLYFLLRTFYFISICLLFPCDALCVFVILYRCPFFHQTLYDTEKKYFREIASVCWGKMHVLCKNAFWCIERNTARREGEKARVSISPKNEQ